MMPTWFRSNLEQFKNPHIVVLGAGFGGLTFCQTLNRSAARITLVNRQNHHLFQPLLYQVATAGLSAPEIAQPIRSILSGQSNVTVLLDHVTGFDLAAKTVRLGKNTLTYDYLVLALGGCTSYFGHPEWEQFSPGLKSLDDALRIRRDILLAFEKAENASDPAEHDGLMTIVVIGGGPTGVELAGAFAELTRSVLQRDFKRIDPAQARVVMIEAAPRVLTQFSPKLSARAEQQLKKLGVEVHTNTKVKAISQGRVDLENGETIFAENIVWAAGVSASPLTQKLGVELDRAGRVKVNPDLNVPGHPEVFAIGDMALVLGEDGKPVPGISPAAMQMAKHVARIIEDELAVGGKSPRPPFRYWDKGSMATIGRSAAVAKMGQFEFSGFPAWLAWLGVHLIFLIGFRNKLAVLVQWAYSYFTYKRGARIITWRTQIEVQLQAALEQSEMLLREVRHRVKNNMQIISSLLRLHSSKLQDPAQLAVFADCRDRIQAMALIHERLYSAGQFPRIEFGGYLAEMVRMILGSSVEAGSRVRLDLQLDSLELSLDTAVPLRLIASELVLNTVKHAFADGQPGVPTVKLRAGNPMHELVLQDDGPGLPADISPAKCAGIGLELVETLTRQIRGQREFNASPEGTTVVIRWPAQPPPGARIFPPLWQRCSTA